MSTIDYDMIVAALQEYKFHSLESALDRCVEEETRALHDIGPKRRDNSREARIAAKGFYGAEIFAELREPSDLTPERVLNTRRAANAWAIAALMRQYGLRAIRETIAVSGTFHRSIVMEKG